MFRNKSHKSGKISKKPAIRTDWPSWCSLLALDHLLTHPLKNKPLLLACKILVLGLKHVREVNRRLEKMRNTSVKRFTFLGLILITCLNHYRTIFQQQELDKTMYTCQMVFSKESILSILEKYITDRHPKTTLGGVWELFIENNKFSQQV